MLKNIKTFDPLSDYSKVIKNILNFLDIKKKKNKKFPLVKVSFIVMKSNKHEINKFKKFWENKVDAIHIQKFIDYEDKNLVTNYVNQTKCIMPMFRLSIKSDGNVRPCCLPYGENINLGNIYKETLLNIWNSKFMKNFQQMHLQNRAYENKFCTKCLKNTNA